jgi:hypothetical protein
MRIPDWRKLQLSDGVVSEPVPEGNRIVLWLPKVRDDGVACRQRVATVAGAEISVEQGIFRLRLSGSSVNPKPPNFATETKVPSQDSLRKLSEIAYCPLLSL